MGRCLPDIGIVQTGWESLQTIFGVRRIWRYRRVSQVEVHQPQCVDVKAAPASRPRETNDLWACPARRARPSVKATDHGDRPAWPTRPCGVNKDCANR